MFMKTLKSYKIHIDFHNNLLCIGIYPFEYIYHHSDTFRNKYLQVNKKIETFWILYIKCI